MRALYWKLGGPVLTLTLAVVAVLVWNQPSGATNPFRAYPPLHAGIGSPGSIIDSQPENPLFFALVKTDWPLLGIDQPRTAWEYVQRGMYRQDDLHDEEAARLDYEHALELLEQLAVKHNDPTLPERLLLIHFRLGPIYLHRHEYHRAIEHFEVLLHEDPSLEGINREIALAYEGIAEEALEHGEDAGPVFHRAYEHFLEELEVAPLNQLTLYEFAHFLLSPEVHLDGVDQSALAAEMLQRYLARAVEHCDTYPMRIVEANLTLTELGAEPNLEAHRNCVDGERIFAPEAVPGD